MTMRFHADFPGGNGLCLGIEEHSRDVVVRFAVEPRNSPCGTWFHFALGGLDNRPVRCVLTNSEQILGYADWSGDRIVYRRDDAPWSRSGAPVVLTSGGGRTEWAFDLPAAERMQVAFCFPYQMEHFHSLAAALGPEFSVEAIGLTAHGRTIPRLRNRSEGREVPGVFLTARHHAGETPGAWVMDGVLRTVAASPALSKQMAWWAVPFVGLDDVVEGNYGKDAWPHDCWTAYGKEIYSFRRPEARAVAFDVRRWAKACRPIMLLDLHAPWHGERRTWMYVGYAERPGEIPDGAVALAEDFRRAVPEQLRSPEACVQRNVSKDRQAGLALCDWTNEMLGIEAVTFEFSYQGNAAADYSIADYQAMGRALAETLAERCGVR